MPWTRERSSKTNNSSETVLNIRNSASARSERMSKHLIQFHKKKKKVPCVVANKNWPVIKRTRNGKSKYFSNTEGKHNPLWQSLVISVSMTMWCLRKRKKKLSTVTRTYMQSSDPRTTRRDENSLLSRVVTSILVVGVVFLSANLNLFFKCTMFNPAGFRLGWLLCNLCIILGLKGIRYGAPLLCRRSV